MKIGNFVGFIANKFNEASSKVCVYFPPKGIPAVDVPREILEKPGLKHSLRVGEIGFKEVEAYLSDYDHFYSVTYYPCKDYIPNFQCQR